MSSQRRILSSRANGAKSRGPKTPEGRARSALNNTRHGLAGESLVVSSESAPHFQEIIDDYMGRFQPADGFEHDLVLDLVAARWRLFRLWGIETSIFDLKMDRLVARLSAKPLVHTRARLAEAFQDLAERSNCLHLVNRYDSRIRRGFDRALVNLMHLQDRRKNKKIPDEPSPANEHPGTLRLPHQDLGELSEQVGEP